MKKISVFLICFLVLIILVGFICTSNVTNKITNSSDLLRIHIRANSNEDVDQNIKFAIKDKFVEFLTPLVVDCQNKTDAICMIEKQKDKLKDIADNILKQNGFEYQSNVVIKKEFFPTRTYENYTVESGVYDAVIVELGDASGNNWWCVIYPPLCFTNFSFNSKNIVYKSKIMEIIKTVKISNIIKIIETSKIVKILIIIRTIRIINLIKIIKISKRS